MAGVLIRGCGREWEHVASEEPDGCPQCGEWRTVEIQRCYECPVNALDESMAGEHGALIARVFHLANLMKAGVRYTPDDLTAEEARVLAMIEAEKPVSVFGSSEETRGA